MDHPVLTVIATDHPGLVGRIAQCITSHGGNWLESRMSRTVRQLVGVLWMAVPVEGYDELVEGLQGLFSHDIRVLLTESGIEPVYSWKLIHLGLVDNDRLGIMCDITRLLAGHGVNLESPSTEVRPASMNSEPLFHADTLLAVPPILSLGTLREWLEDLTDGLMVELMLDASWGCSGKQGDESVEKPWVKPWSPSAVRLGGYSVFFDQLRYDYSQTRWTSPRVFCADNLAGLHPWAIQGFGCFLSSLSCAFAYGLTFAAVVAPVHK